MKNFLQGTILASKAILISVVALVVLVAAASAVYGVARFGDSPRWFASHHLPHYVVDHVVDEMADELDLSDAQRGQITTVLDDAVRQVRRSRGSYAARMEAAAALLKRPQLSAEDVQSALQAGDRHADTEAVIADALAQVHGILTPPQRDELAERMQDGDWFHHHRHRRHHRHHRGHGYYDWLH